MNREAKPKPLITLKRRKKPALASPKRTSLGSKAQLKRKPKAPPNPQRANLKASPTRFRAKPLSPIFSILQIAVLTVGISTIVGSGISLLNDWNQEVIESSLPDAHQPAIAVANNSQQSQLENLFSLTAVGQEIAPLKQELIAATANYPQLQAGIFIADISSKSFVNVAGTNSVSAASTIKLPILVAFFQEVDAGKASLKEILKTSKENIGGGSGYMQYQPVGTQHTALKTATKMITISDNTATNMLMERLGGAKELNQRFTEWGLTHTRIRNLLPDLTGTNTTTPEDLSNLLLKLDRGELVSPESRDRILEIMQQTERNTLLPQGIEPEATIAHKTGDIKSVLGDSGLISLPSGKRYIVSVLVKRPDNDPQAKALIQEISRITYRYFQQQPTPGSTVSTQPLDESS